jgi:hypothetical protein
MSPHLFLLRAIEPGLSLLPSYMTSDAARVMLMAIAIQESNIAARAQIGRGPARGYWQFEPAGVEAVLKQTPALAQAVLSTCDIPLTDASSAVQYNDPVACAFARLILWFETSPLPAIGDTSGSWHYYCRCWRPGKPDENRWPMAHATAVNTVAAEKQ